jgi:hypothetical protein
VKATYVKPNCIKNVGAPGKGIAPTIPSLRKGRIPSIHYDVQQPASFRHQAIARGVARDGREMMEWRLRWEGTWRSKATGQQKEWSRILLGDAKWLRGAKADQLKIQPLECPPTFKLRKAYSYVRDGKTVNVRASCVK